MKSETFMEKQIIEKLQKRGILNAVLHCVSLKNKRFLFTNLVVVFKNFSRPTSQIFV